MKIREMTQKDVEYMAAHSISKPNFDKEPTNLSVSVTLEEEGIPLVTGGIQMITATTGWCWLNLSSEAGKHIVITYRLIRTWIDEMVEKMGIIRLQCYVAHDYEEGHNMVRHLGFEYEYTMEKFIEEEPADMYIKVK